MVAATSSTKSIWNAAYLRERLVTALLNPIRAFRPRYLPLLMVYFAYGALGLIAVAESFWVKKALTLTPAELAELAGWLTLPWTVKMVFGELVDAVPIFGSQRRAYVFIGAAFIALGMLLLAGAAGGWLTFASLENLYRLGAFSSVLGVVIQDVAADAMSTEVVDRENPDGSPRDKDEVDRELGMVQVLGRLALSFGIFLVAGVAGWIAGVYSYATVFLVGLIIPVISVSGAALITLKPVESSPIDWRILGGGIAYGAFVLALALADVPYNQEIVFVVSMVVVCAMLVRVVRRSRRGDQAHDLLCGAHHLRLSRDAARRARATPGSRSTCWASTRPSRARWRRSGPGSRCSACGCSRMPSRGDRCRVVLLWLTIVTTILSLPSLGLTLGLADWTERVFGFGARTHRHHRHGGDLAVRAAQHDPAADAHRDLRARRGTARRGLR